MNVSLYGLRFLEKEYPERFKISLQSRRDSRRTLELFDAVGKFRGCLAGGGLVDYDKTAELVVREIRSEKMGPLTFELQVRNEKPNIEE